LIDLDEIQEKNSSAKFAKKERHCYRYSNVATHINRIKKQRSNDMNERRSETRHPKMRRNARDIATAAECPLNHHHGKNMLQHSVLWMYAGVTR
jgi:hypothetical protein